jgi:hypothetical protein
MRSLCEHWNIKGRLETMHYFSKRRRVPEDELQLNGHNVTFVDDVYFRDVIFDRKITYRLNTDMTATKLLGSFMRIYSKARD